jgi:HK97 family phage major capsid protein
MTMKNHSFVAKSFSEQYCCKNSNPKGNTMSKVDIRGLGILTREATELTNRSTLTSQEQRRFTLLTQQISLLRSGEVTLAELQAEETNDIARRHGMPETRVSKPSMNAEERAKAEAWQVFFKVQRENRTATDVEGNILARIGTYTGLGEFVPTEFVTEVYAAMGAHDALLDEDAVSVMNSANGRVTTVPTYGDIENVAAVVGESADTSSGEALISVPGHAVIGAYSYRSPLWRLSIEAMQDVEAMGGAIELFKAFAADRIARGAARDLAVGNGSSKPLGLIPSLIAAGVTPTVAVGSAGNTGGTEDGTNSIGSEDIAKLYYSVNEAYRSQPKASFFMNDSTRAYLSRIVNKMGAPLVHWQGPEAFIFGKPIRISPSMDGIGVSKYPVVFGDGAYWLTRKIVDDNSYVQLVKEAAGLIEKGEMALRMFCRFDGELLYNDAGSPSPFGLLQNHS